jgi:hypothetical protein
MFFMQASGTQLAHNGQTSLLFDDYVMRRRVFSWIHDDSACATPKSTLALALTGSFALIVSCRMESPV